MKKLIIGIVFSVVSLLILSCSESPYNNGLNQICFSTKKYPTDCLCCYNLNSKCSASDSRTNIYYLRCEVAKEFGFPIVEQLGVSK